MAKLVWDQVGTHLYESGITKGVFYTSDGRGVPWNGLTAIDAKRSDDVDPVHFDGVKFNDIVTIGDFSADLKAFTYPEEFLKYEGVLEDSIGFYVTGQSLNKFGLSYQTLIGSDIHPIGAAYKIHVLYNLTAIPSQVQHQTLSTETEPVEFEWEISSIPDDIDRFRPTSHVIIDSREMDQYLLQDIEDILYGSEENDAQLPPLKGLSSFIRKWNRLIIIDNGDGTWTAESPLEEYINMLDATTFEITSDTAVYLDADTYEISSSEKNEEDVWLP